MCKWMDECAVRRWREALEFGKNGNKTDAGIFFRSETSILTFLREIKKHLYCTHLYYLCSLITPLLWKSLPIVLPLTADQYRGFLYRGQAESRVCSLVPYIRTSSVWFAAWCCKMMNALMKALKVLLAVAKTQYRLDWTFGPRLHFGRPFQMTPKSYQQEGKPQRFRLHALQDKSRVVESGIWVCAFE